MTDHGGRPTRPSVAVIGSGVSGLTAAHLLSRTHDVTLFEADARLGGHAHTHTVPTSSGGQVRVDSGFIVHNERTYPNLLRLFRELGVPTRPTEMSMSISCDGCGLSWAGGRGPGAVLAQPRRIADPRFVRMLTEIPRFHRAARAVLEAKGGGDAEEEPTWGEFLEREGFTDYFIAHFALPLISCVWSSGDRDSLDYPARHLFTFLEHHGMLGISGSPRWRTVVGGSATYVDALAARLGDVRTGTPVTPPSPATPTGLTCAPPARSPPSTGRSWRPTPTRRSRSWPTRPRRRRRTSPRSATPATKRCSTATPGTCRRRGGPESLLSPFGRPAFESGASARSSDDSRRAPQSGDSAVGSA